MICRKSDTESAQIAADYLRRGRVVVLPTDTIYGFSGIVDGKHYSFRTDEKIRVLKGSGGDKPLIKLIAEPSDLKKYTRDLLPDNLLAQWPGPLTIIVHTFSDTGDFTTTAFRCPGDEWLRSVIARCGAPLYSTSVNRSGSPALGNISGIKAEFGALVDLIVDDGDKSGGVPSTVVQVDETGGISVVRQGALTI